MPRYLFNLVSDRAEVRDHDGVDLADPWSARREAFLIADDLIRPGAPIQLRKWRGWSVQVVDERGGEVLRVPIGDLRPDTRDAAPGRPMSAGVVDRVAISHAAPDPVDRLTSDFYARLSAEAQHLAAQRHQLAAQRLRQGADCTRLRRAIRLEIERAQETARLSAQLIAQCRDLPVGPLLR
ncbi:MAG TPA: hypothetical protein VLX44_17585 [Xanthobacteraceae bacterium]|nr:hypothetical protein [Xanthobacteraceae bacterium]